MLKRYIKNDILRNIIEWMLAIAIAFAVFLIFNNFVVKSSRIDGSSMEPSYFHNDRVFINRLTYSFREPAFGDVIAFPFEGYPPGYYVKRIVGMPLDTIDFQEGFFYINGTRLNDEFSYEPSFIGDRVFPIVVAQDYFFVLGDNRDISFDSRFENVGDIHIDSIIGRVSFRWFPFERFGFAR